MKPIRYSAFLITGIGLLVTLSSSIAFGQDNNKELQTEDESRYELTTSFYGGSQGELPFWFYANQSGKVDPSGSNWLNEFSFYKPLWKQGELQLSTGGTAVSRWSKNSSTFFPRLYLNAEGYGFLLRAGRFHQPIGLNNHDLSVGSMMVSHNAVPVPKISISTPNYMDVPFSNGIVQYRGMFSHGWINDDRYVEDPYLHQKYLYLRINIESFSATGGIVHNAQWGGTDPNRGRLPQSFENYLRLITGRGATDDSNAPSGEKWNVIGNSVAAYDFGLSYKQQSYEVSLTRMFYLEDKVSTRFRSPWDGVWGLNLELQQGGVVEAVTYEHINTKNQDAKSWELIGRRDYYDNFVYRSGWTYEGRTLGIPLIIFDGETISNNVLFGHHLGVRGMLMPQLKYMAKFTYSRNYGVQDDWIEYPADSVPNDREDIIPREEFRKDQYSWLLALDYRLEQYEGLSIQMKIASDTGDLYTNNLGVVAGLKWSLSNN
jgi:hypothetical protein